VANDSERILWEDVIACPMYRATKIRKAYRQFASPNACCYPTKPLHFHSIVVSRRQTNRLTIPHSTSDRKFLFLETI